MFHHRFVKYITNTLLINTICFYSAHAQFNDSTHYYINVNSTGTINKTNGNTSYILSNGVRFSTRKKKWQLNSTNAWLYGEQQRKLTNNDISSFWDINLYPSGKRLYYWALASYEKSYSLKLNHRFQAGGGVAFNIIDQQNSFLNISDGILYEKSDLSLTDSTRDVYNTFRNSFRLRFKYTIKELVVIDGTNFLQK
jgi:hypothetical protein